MRNKLLTIRATDAELKKWHAQAVKKGFIGTGAYVRWLLTAYADLDSEWDKAREHGDRNGTL